MEIIKKIRNVIKYFYKDNLYRNAGYLMLSDAVVGVLGFVFLMMATHLYSSYDIGMYSAMVSMMSLIVLFSMSQGFGNALIRLIPQASQTDKGKLIFSSSILVILIVTVIAFIFIFFIDVFSPKLLFLKDIIYGSVFVLFTVFSAIFFIFPSIFMAFRKTQYLLIRNVTSYTGNIILLPLFVSFLYIGIFYSYGIGTFLGLIVSMFFFYKMDLLKNFGLRLNFNIIKKNLNYIFTNYLSSIASNLPALLFPILILNILSAQATAYFYVAWAIFSSITALIMAIIMSFFVEGSYNENEIKKNRNKGLKASLIISTLCLLAVILFGKFVLSLFGQEYLNSLDLLYVFTLSIYLFAINKTYLVELLIRKKMRETIIYNFLITISTIIFGIISMFYFGLIGVGYGWVIGQTIGLIYILFFKKTL